MAGVLAAADAACWTNVSISGSSTMVAKAGRKNSSSVVGVRRLNLHGGLKAQNGLMAMGKCASTEVQFADMVAHCRSVRNSGPSRGGAAAATCDVGAEILTVIPVICAITLIGVALGFVLLRVEAFIEEQEE